jgi:NadR type nicotinamide-nucleotide adenylyltransferase
MIKSITRIAITGPESTGKSELAQKLAQHYHTLWVPEYAREYINQLNRPYTFADILTIAKRQVALEKEMLNKSNRILFSDTELIVCKIWCEYKFEKCHSWILKNLEKQSYDLYLLMDIDLSWQPDPQREHPDKRVELFNLYLDELISRNCSFEIVSGSGEQRFINALNIIKKGY